MGNSAPSHMDVVYLCRATALVLYSIPSGSITETHTVGGYAAVRPLVLSFVTASPTRLAEVGNWNLLLL